MAPIRDWTGAIFFWIIDYKIREKKRSSSIASDISRYIWNFYIFLEH